MLCHRPSRSPIALFMLAVAALGLAACNQKSEQHGAAGSAATAPAAMAPATADPYDQSQMDFKPGPAKLSSERHTGPFATGSALSMDATLKPLVPDTVKEIR